MRRRVVESWRHRLLKKEKGKLPTLQRLSDDINSQKGGQTDVCTSGCELTLCRKLLLLLNPKVEFAANPKGSSLRLCWLAWPFNPAVAVSALAGLAGPKGSKTEASKERLG
jgi:hypothetical protein